jgi:hypothetical protein
MPAANPFILCCLRDGIKVAYGGEGDRRNRMRIKKKFSVVALLLVSFLGAGEIQAQTTERKFVVSPLYTAINLQAFDSRESGAGVRLSYDINNYLAVEAEGNIFEFSIGDHPTDDKLAAQALLGIKTGFRNRRIGVFAKLRPGVVNFPELRVRRSFCFLGQPCNRTERSGNRLAVDAGAVVELYPTRKIVVRIDVGDTMIRFQDDQIIEFPAPLRIPDGFSHNLQLTGSIGFRF